MWFRGLPEGLFGDPDPCRPEPHASGSNTAPPPGGARFERRPDGAIAYAFAPGRHGYIVQRGNPPGSTARSRSRPSRPGPAPPPSGSGSRASSPRTKGRGSTSCSTATPGGSPPSASGCAGARRSTSFRAPPGASSASLALRLTGAGTLPPLALSYKLQPEDAADGAAALAAAVAAFDRLALLAGGAESRIAGVHDFADPRLGGRRLAIRPDQGVPASAALPVAGLVFDDTIPPPFGWQGVFDENLYANLALVRILGQMERVGLPTILVYDEGTETKPFFPDLATLFAHQVRKDPEAEARVARLLRLA